MTQHLVYHPLTDPSSLTTSASDSILHLVHHIVETETVHFQEKKNGHVIQASTFLMYELILS